MKLFTSITMGLLIILLATSLLFRLKDLSDDVLLLKLLVIDSEMFFS
jgi:hypothetical protein